MHELAAYACDPKRSRGRLIQEPTSPTRSVFQRDRDRIIHSDAFRRLKHKTQVFVHHEGDHYRTRLTHSIEVGQIARALARALRLDEDLAETLALAHDFGHPPFGHAGERELDALLSEYGGFDHNAQALKVVTELERRYADFDGLNLTWETLEGLVKHNGPLGAARIPEAIERYNATHDLELVSWPSAEAQCAAIADDIAYDNHDVDDGLRAELFSFCDLQEVAFSAELLDEVDRAHPDLERERKIHELVRRQITRMVEDVIEESRARLEGLQSCEAVRSAGCASVAFSSKMAANEAELGRFMFDRMYRHPLVMRPVAAGRSILRDLFRKFVDGTAPMPKTAQWSLEGLSAAQRARRVADYLAGMTDRYAIAEHRKLFDHTPTVR